MAESSEGREMVSSFTMDAIESPQMSAVEEVLACLPACVQTRIRTVLHAEYASSHSTRAKQIAAFRQLTHEMLSINGSPEAANLRHFLNNDISERRVLSLQNLDTGIQKDIEYLKKLISDRDITQMNAMAERIEQRACKFEEKYDMLLSKTMPLVSKVQQAFEHAVASADECLSLAKEAAERRDTWLRQFNFVMSSRVMPGMSTIAEVIADYRGSTNTAASGAANAVASRTVKVASGGAKAASTAVAVASGAAKAVSSKAVASGAAKAVVASGATKAVVASGATKAVVASGATKAVVASGATKAVVASGATKAVVASGATKAVVASGAVAFGGAATAAWAACKYVGPIIAWWALLEWGRYALKGYFEDLCAGLQGESRKFEDKAKELKDALDKLTSMMECTGTMRQVFDEIAVVAEELVGQTKAAKLVEVSGDLEALGEKVTELARAAEKVNPAFLDLSEAMKDLSHVQLVADEPIKLCEAGPSGALQASEQADVVQSTTAPTHGFQDTNLLQHSDECEDEVFIDDGWILVEPGSPEGILHENEVLQQDCVPMGSSMLVPIDRIAQPTHGIIFAAGPQGNQMCEIIRQEPARRSIAQFSVADCGTFRLTGDHELKIRRGGVWSVVQAREVQVGDFVTTPEGEKEVVHRGEPKISTEPVCKVSLCNPPVERAEVFIFTSSADRDQKSFSGLAVLGKDPRDELSDVTSGTMRSASSPPQLGAAFATSAPSEVTETPSASTGLPSWGSRFHPASGNCPNICRRFQRGRCDKGSECHFCHEEHKESTRAPRGPRAERKTETEID